MYEYGEVKPYKRGGKSWAVIEHSVRLIFQRSLLYN
jgi:hypothetical protein